MDSGPAFVLDETLNGLEPNDSLPDLAVPAPSEPQTDPTATLSAPRRWTHFAVVMALALAIVAAMAVIVFNPVVIVAGISRVGTVAAGEFLTQIDLLGQLISKLPAHSEQKNIEAVLGVQVINGVAASPQVLAATTW